VATQAFVETSYGPLGLALMRAGKTAQESLDGLLAADRQRDLRQVAMVDQRGSVATHTGSRCIADAGHITGEQFSVQANMMANPSVWPAMASAFRKAGGDLVDRMLAALEAAQSAGGDIRGRQSAAILVVPASASGQPWNDTLFNLQVADHPDPIGELARLVRLQRAYRLMNSGDDYLGLGQMEEALESYRQAAASAPEVLEMPFWHAVTLADMGHLEESLPIFKQVFTGQPQWADLLVRLPPSGLLRDDPQMIARILAEKQPI
jgi:uncharacterized Ntn-hydrolase superfamily protein